MLLRANINGVQITSCRDESLSDTVSQIIEINGPTHYETERIFPRNTPEILFNLRDPLLGIYQGEEHFLSRFVIQGSKAKPFEVIPEGYQHFISLRFKPNGFFKLLGIPQSEFTEQFHPLDQVCQDAEVLLQQLKVADGENERFKLLINWLNKLHPSEHRTDGCLSDYIIEQFRKHPGMSITDLSERIGYSRKHLVETFKKEVGMTLKRFQRINRFNIAYDLLDSYESIRWNTLGFLTGYYDQSHFIKEFKEFTGLTPGEFSRGRKHGRHIISG